MWAVLTQHREPWVLSPKTSMVEIEAGQSRVRVILLRKEFEASLGYVGPSERK